MFKTNKNMIFCFELAIITKMGAEDSSGERSVRPIRTSRELAENLGFQRDPKERPTSPYRTYRRDFPLSAETVTPATQNIKTFVELAFQDVGTPGITEKKGERISLSFHLGEESVWRTKSTETDLSLLLRSDEFREIGSSLGLVKQERGDWDKRVLQQGGYQKIFRFIEEIEKRGYFESKFQELIELFEAGRPTLPILEEKVSQFLPDYSDFIDNYKKGGEWLYFKKPDRNDKATRVLIFTVHPNSVGIQSGRLFLKSGETFENHQSSIKDVYEFAPPFKIRLPNLRASNWVFKDSEEDRKRVLDLALDYIKEELVDIIEPGTIIGIEEEKGMFKDSAEKELEPFSNRVAVIQFPDGRILRRNLVTSWKIGDKIIRRAGMYIETSPKPEN